MLNPLSNFKKSLLKDIIVLGKKFTFNTANSLKSLNKIDILINTLYSVENVKLSEFDSIKNELERGLTYEEAVRKEIESWEPEIINILVTKLIKILENQEIIDFKKYPDLRIYWKIRKIFSKEEVDSWSDIDYQWAVWNLQEDFKEKDEFDDRAFEKRKPWMDFDLYKHLNKKEQEKKEQEQENKLLIQKLMEQQGINTNNIEIELVNEEEDIPTVIEE